MSLFTINRYDSIHDDNNLEEHIHLEKLKHKIEERKKNRLQDITRVDVSAISVEIEESKENLTKSEIIEPQETDEDPAHKLIRDNVNSFKILGSTAFEKASKVKRVLPYWLTNPSPISIDLKQNIVNTENIDFLDNSLKKKLIQNGLNYLFPVQAQVIPWLLKENKSTAFWARDLCVSAPTGSGKTLTYVLPVIQLLTDRVERQIRAIVILPVKELASQVAKVFKEYCIGTNLKVALLSGSTSFAQEQIQITKYVESIGWRSEADIIICTAGRLVEHLYQTDGFSLKHLRYLIMDEADRIMDHIQNDWLHHLNRRLHLEDSLISQNSSLNSKIISTHHHPPQKLLFSATLSQDPEKLKQWDLFQPKLFSVDQQNNNGKTSLIEKFVTPLELNETYTICSPENKPIVLYHILKVHNCKRVLCFTNSSKSAHRLTLLLSYLMNSEMTVAELSASLSKNSRETVLKCLHSGKVNMLISTDALSRGIDVQDCDLVISYDPPKNAKTYIHRIGRTGRAGRLGKAITILQYNQSKMFQELLKTSGKLNIEKFEVSQEALNNYCDQYTNAIEFLEQNLNDESQTMKINLKQRKRGNTLQKTSKSNKHSKNSE